MSQVPDGRPAVAAVHYGVTTGHPPGLPADVLRSVRGARGDFPPAVRRLRDSEVISDVPLDGAVVKSLPGCDRLGVEVA